MGWHQRSGSSASGVAPVNPARQGSSSICLHSILYCIHRTTAAYRWVCSPAKRTATDRASGTQHASIRGEIVVKAACAQKELGERAPKGPNRARGERSVFLRLYRSVLSDPGCARLSGEGWAVRRCGGVCAPQPRRALVARGSCAVGPAPGGMHALPVQGGLCFSSRARGGAQEQLAPALGLNGN